MTKQHKERDVVWIPRLDRHGTIIGTRNNGKLAVQVASTTFALARGELEPSRATERVALASGRSQDLLGTVRLRHAPSTVDLHGLIATEAQHALEVAIDLAIRANLERLEIIHGKGSGILRELTHSVLSGIPSIKRYVENPLNPGVTYAYFR